MTQTRRSILLVLVAGLVGTTTAPATHAAAVKRPRRPTVIAVDTPVGLQGADGAGANVVVAFRLYDRHRRRSNVEVQYGWDRNGDGKITDGTERNQDGRSAGQPDEYAPATEDVTDPRDSRAVSPFLNPAKLRPFRSDRGNGAADVFVWKSAQDVRTATLTKIEYALTPQGRRIPDPDNPGSFLFATGPDGSGTFAGVRLRARARPRHEKPGRWVYTEPFSLDNSGKPSMAIDAAASSSSAAPSTVLVNWTAFHPDSEDLNGNGVLDVALGEDTNWNGMLDPVHVGVAFDWHRLAPGEDPTTMTPAQLAALSWSPCTREIGVGDTDSLDARPGVPVPTSGDLAGVACAPFPVGRHWVFAWDSAADVGATTDGFILRAAPFDQQRSVGATVYSTIVVRPGR
jgi:hypothetical protein